MESGTKIEVKYPGKTIKLLPWWDTDVAVIKKYFEKISEAIKRIAEYYGKNILFIDNCVVLPLTYVLKYEVKKETFDKGMIVYSDEYAVILLDDEEYEEDYIEDKEACFVVEPLKALDP